jgi:hypothetical protein
MRHPVPDERKRRICILGAYSKHLKVINVVQLLQAFILLQLQSKSVAN